MKTYLICAIVFGAVFLTGFVAEQPIGIVLAVSAVYGLLPMALKRIADRINS